MCIIGGFSLLFVLQDLIDALTFLVLLIFAIPPAVNASGNLLRKQLGGYPEQAGYDDDSAHGRSVYL